MGEGKLPLVFVNWEHVIHFYSNTLGDFSQLHFFETVRLKIKGLIHCFWPLHAIITAILLVCTQAQLYPGQLNYDLFLSWQAQIIMHSSTW